LICGLSDDNILTDFLSLTAGIFGVLSALLGGSLTLYQALEDLLQHWEALIIVVTLILISCFTPISVTTLLAQFLKTFNEARMEYISTKFRYVIYPFQHYIWDILLVLLVVFWPAEITLYISIVSFYRYVSKPDLRDLNKEYQLIKDGKQSLLGQTDSPKIDIPDLKL